ncbi:hypothetical protein HAX54_032522 [Datura stramonium]|uniref:Uncharacterized protein n=1 Tax=Datura stramonium TaxID=4076 RepID=A0ABS8VAU2_DATST|nr:hypothetical protein [Datura stramonium]
MATFGGRRQNRLSVGNHISMWCMLYCGPKWPVSATWRPAETKQKRNFTTLDVVIDVARHLTQQIQCVGRCSTFPIVQKEFLNGSPYRACWLMRCIQEQSESRILPNPLWAWIVHLDFFLFAGSISTRREITLQGGRQVSAIGAARASAEGPGRPPVAAVSHGIVQGGKATRQHRRAGLRCYRRSRTSALDSLASYNS